MSSIAESNNVVPPSSGDEWIVKRVRALKSIVPKRARKARISNPDLLLIMELLQNFNANTSNRAPPSKTLLFESVQALLLPSARALSKKWSKSQLVSVLLQWAMEAEALAQYENQSDLYVDLRVSKSKPKELAHAVFLQQDDGYFETMSVYSPSPPPKKRPGSSSATAVPIMSSSENEASEVYRTPESRPHKKCMGNSNLSLPASASSFLRELESIATCPGKNPGVVNFEDEGDQCVGAIEAALPLENPDDETFGSGDELDNLSQPKNTGPTNSVLRSLSIVPESPPVRWPLNN